MVTASYLSDGMAELHDKAAEAGVTVVNEVGVDPGKFLYFCNFFKILKILGNFWDLIFGTFLPQ